MTPPAAGSTAEPVTSVTPLTQHPLFAELLSAVSVNNAAFGTSADTRLSADEPADATLPVLAEDPASADTPPETGTALPVTGKALPPVAAAASEARPQPALPDILGQATPEEAGTQPVQAEGSLPHLTAYTPLESQDPQQPASGLSLDTRPASPLSATDSAQQNPAAWGLSPKPQQPPVAPPAPEAQDLADTRTRRALSSMKAPQTSERGGQSASAPLKTATPAPADNAPQRTVTPSVAAPQPGTDMPVPKPALETAPRTADLSAPVNAGTPQLKPSAQVESDTVPANPAPTAASRPQPAQNRVDFGPHEPIAARFTPATAGVVETDPPAPAAYAELRRPLSVSAAALYGRVQTEAQRQRNTGGGPAAENVAVLEAKAAQEAASERMVSPQLRVEPGSVVDAARLLHTSVEGRAPIAQSAASVTAPAVSQGVSQSIQDQVMRVITRQAVQQGKLQVQLNPRELGVLDIEFTHDRSGEVQVTIVAKEPATRELLDAGLPRLRQSLVDAGVQLSDLDVRQQDEEQRHHEKASSGTLADSADEPGASHNKLTPDDAAGLLNVYV